jgi:predicted transcriptional regulator of viral defense system
VLVSLRELAILTEEVGLRTPAKVIAARLRATGWLLPTGQRGIYEFAPGAHAGPYGHGDPFIGLRAALSAGHSLTVALQSALWLHGLAERAPDRHELAAPRDSTVPAAVRRGMRVVRFSAQLPAAQVDQLPVHQAATILVHMATKPGDVRGWATFAEALPELAARSTLGDLEHELSARPGTARPRLAYLLSGAAPALADRLQPTTPSAVTWFGSSRSSRRYDKRFNVADGLLPFDPRTLEEPA